MGGGVISHHWYLVHLYSLYIARSIYQLSTLKPPCLGVNPQSCTTILIKCTKYRKKCLFMYVRNPLLDTDCQILRQGAARRYKYILSAKKI